MAYDEGLAERIRGVLEEHGAVSERRMFGGIAFMMRGHMTVGVLKDELMVRVGPEAYPAALREPHARSMDFTGRPMKGIVFVAPEGIEDDADLGRWIEKAMAFTSSLPQKEPGLKPPRRGRATRQGR